MKYTILFACLIIIGCSEPPSIINTARPKVIEYHKSDPYRCYRLEINQYPSISKMVEKIIEKNPSGWKHYSTIADPVPHIVIRAYNGTNQVYALSVMRSGYLIIRDFEKSDTLRKRDTARSEQLTIILDETIERNSIAPSSGREPKE